MNARELRASGYSDYQIRLVLGQEKLEDPKDRVIDIIDKNTKREEDIVNFVGTNRILRAACHSASAAHELIQKKEKAQDSLTHLQNVKQKAIKN